MASKAPGVHALTIVLTNTKVTSLPGGSNAFPSNEVRLMIPESKGIRPGKPFLASLRDLVARANHQQQDISIVNLDLLFSKAVDIEVRRRFLLAISGYAYKVFTGKAEFDQEELNKWAVFETRMQIIPSSAKKLLDIEKTKSALVEEICEDIRAESIRKSDKGMKVLTDGLYSPSTAKALGAIMIMRSGKDKVVPMKDIVDYLNTDLNLLTSGKGKWRQPTVSKKFKQMLALRPNFIHDRKLYNSLMNDQDIIAGDPRVYLRSTPGEVEIIDTDSDTQPNEAREPLPVIASALTKAKPGDKVKTLLTLTPTGKDPLAGKYYILRISNNKGELIHVQKIQFSSENSPVRIDLWRDCHLLPGQYYITINDADNFIIGDKKGEGGDAGYAPIFTTRILGGDLFAENYVEYPIKPAGDSSDVIKLRRKNRNRDRKDIVADHLKNI